MEDMTVRYESLEQMEQGVEQLSDEGWVLQRLTRSPEWAFTAEFVQRESIVSS
ncbi:MAG: hypothetical protein M3Q29_15630 [Chloroflexota bacterium]|nr:hypothetical protein [Chloroflexota bacterium]